MKNKQICVLGAGLMGVGIATHFARFGHDIWLYDTDSSRIAEISHIASGIVDELIATEQFALSEKASVMNRLHGTTSLQDIAACGLLIEAIPERLELKHALYAQLEELIAPEAVIASNTSGLPPDALAEKLAYPERLLIAHFWNPPHFIPLVEIVPGTATKAEYLHELQHYCCRCNWKRSCSIAPRQGLSATVCNSPCYVKRCISLKAVSPARRWWIR